MCIDQCQRYGTAYPADLWEYPHYNELTEGRSSKAIDVSFRKRSQKRTQRKPISNQPLSRKDAYDDPGCGNRLCQVVPKGNKYYRHSPPRPVYPEECQDGKRTIFALTALKVLFSVDTAPTIEAGI